MTPTHIQVTFPNGKVSLAPITLVERVCVQINHCLTAKQTAQAMADGRSLRSGHTVHRNGWTVEPLEQPEQ